MAVYELAEQPKKKKVMGLADFPPCARNNYGSVTHMVTTYLRRLMESAQHKSECDGLIVPSVTVLSEYFECNELDVLEAFHELRRQGYDYEIQGLDMPICYYDLLSREVEAESGAWATLGEMFGRIWQALRPDQPGTLRPTT